MAGSVAATQRRSHGPLKPGSPTWRRQLLERCTGLMRPDQHRSLCFSLAVLLSGLALMAEHFSPVTLAGCLLFSATLLAALASTGGLRRPAELEETSSRMALMPHISTGMLEDLLRAAESGNRGDAAQWSRLTSRMSHELRTPLNAVIGFSELMKGEVFGPLGSETYADYARNIHRSGRTLLKSAEDALAITSLLTCATERINAPLASLDDAIVEAVQFHASDIDAADLGLCVDIDPGLDVLADAQSVRQIMINLMSEAMLRADAASQLSVQSEGFSNEALVSVRVRAPASLSCETAESFSLLLSRTLAQFCGARLEETAATDELWEVTVHFPRASQRDFFTHTGH